MDVGSLILIFITVIIGIGLLTNLSDLTTNLTSQVYHSDNEVVTLTNGIGVTSFTDENAKLILDDTSMINAETGESIPSSNYVFSREGTIEVFT